MSAPTSEDSTEKGRRRWPWLLLAVAILLVAGGGYWWLSQPAEQRADTPEAQPPLVRATDIARADRVTLRQTGFVRASDEIDVVPERTARIVEVGSAFEVGAEVARGDLLIRLDTTAAQADLRSAQARLRQAEAALSETRMSLSRQQELRADGVVSEAVLEDAQVSFARAEADVEVAEADVSRAVVALNDTRIRAPFDAVVTEERASVGQLVQAGTPIGHLVATDSVEIEMGLLPGEIALLGRAADAVGLPVTVADPDIDGATREGVVTAIVPALNTETRTIGLLVRVEDPFSWEAPLRIGALMELSLEVPLGATAGLRLPAEALKGGDTLWQIADGRLSRHEVAILSRDGDSVTVRTDEIAPGDLILLSDLAAPVEGDRVRVDEDAMQVAEGR